MLLGDLLLLPHHDLDALVAERPVIQAHQVQSLVEALSRAGLARPAALDLDRVVGHLLRHRAEVKQTGGAAGIESQLEAIRGHPRQLEVIKGHQRQLEAIRGTHEWHSPEVKWVAWQAAVEERPGRLEPVELRKLPRRFITLERDRGHLWGRRVARRGERVHARQGRISSMFVAKLVGVMFVGLERVLQSVAISGNHLGVMFEGLERVLPRDHRLLVHRVVAGVPREVRLHSHAGRVGVDELRGNIDSPVRGHEGS